MANLEGAINRETDSDLRYMMGKSYEGLQAYNPGDLIMTDDKAPVELLGMQIIDEIIVDEVNYYKRIYKDKGLSGLLELI